MSAVTAAGDKAGVPSRGDAETGRRAVVVFGFDSAEASQVRRIAAFERIGYDVHAFTMRRGDRSHPVRTGFSNTHLFWTDHEKLWKRVVVIVLSVIRIALFHRARMRAADVIVARNLDMLAIAWAARLLCGRTRVPLVYECLDIHRNMTGGSAKNRLFRAAERFLLGRSQALVVSSPGFVRGYFAPVQGYDGPWALWENKVVADAALPARPTRAATSRQGPLRLGWVGSIRCKPTLDLMLGVARRMGDAIEIHIHGHVHDHALPGFHAAVAAAGNVVHHGGYRYPADLPRVYGAIDLVWASDLWQAGGNSDWSLTNRLYEASWCGCPGLGSGDTETTRRIRADGLGWVIDRADPDLLADLLRGLDRDAIHACATRLLARPASDFQFDDADLRAVLDAPHTAAPARSWQTAAETGSPP
ncbi:MAG: glycosyl transferase [Rhodobacteraceae bacterium]|nr:glycosyl transferase [Paracoccaceae bacterium]